MSTLAKDFNLVIRNCQIVDRAGAAAFQADDAVRDGMIAAVGRFAKGCIE